MPPPPAPIRAEEIAPSHLDPLSSSSSSAIQMPWIPLIHACSSAAVERCSSPSPVDIPLRQALAPPSGATPTSSSARCGAPLLPTPTSPRRQSRSSTAAGEDLLLRLLLPLARGLPCSTSPHGQAARPPRRDIYIVGKARRRLSIHGCRRGAARTRTPSRPAIRHPRWWSATTTRSDELERSRASIGHIRMNFF